MIYIIITRKKKLQYFRQSDSKMFQFIAFLALVSPAICVQPFMFEFGPQVGDFELERKNGAVANFTLSKPLTNFFGMSNTQIYVGFLSYSSYCSISINHRFIYLQIDSDGVIWPGWYCGGICDAPARSPFPVLTGYQIVACYWADVDLSANPNSHVYYRVANDFSTISTANVLVQKAYGKSNFDTTSKDLTIIIATWVNVTYEGGNENTNVNSGVVLTN